MNDVKEMGYIYLGVAGFGLIITMIIFFISRIQNRKLDKAEAQIDLREKKNKEISDGLSMIFTLYFKSNETKVENHILGKLNERKKRLFNIFKNKNKVIEHNEDPSIFKEILKSPSENFEEYIDGKRSLYELVSGDTKRGSIKKRSSVKVVPYDPNSMDFKRTSHRDSRKSLLGMLISTLGFRSLEVPEAMKKNIRDYLNDKFIRKDSRGGTWFSRAASN